MITATRILAIVGHVYPGPMATPANAMWDLMELIVKMVILGS